MPASAGSEAAPPPGFGVGYQDGGGVGPRVAGCNSAEDGDRAPSGTRTRPRALGPRRAAGRRRPPLRPDRRGRGLVAALFLTAFLAGLAGRGTGPVRAALIAVALTVLCVLVFVVGLQLRLPLLPTWFR